VKNLTDEKENLLFFGIYPYPSQRFGNCLKQ